MGYQHLLAEKLPKVLHAAFLHIGLKEGAGVANNPTIMGWAKDIGGWVVNTYNADSVPWCGLFMAHCASQAGYPHKGNVLSARHWATWGIKQDVAMLGDVLVFSRKGGGHVGLYVGEDADCYHVLGGNQGDAVSIVRILKSRCIAIRRSPWKIKQPSNVRRVFIDSSTKISDNEA